MASGVLKDHKRVGKVLIPPFVHQLGPMRDVSWIKQMLPELCWIALVHEACGDRRAVQLVTALARAARSASGTSGQVFAACSSYANLDEPATAAVRASLLGDRSLADLQVALAPLVGNYPGCSLGCLYETKPSRGEIATVRTVLGRLFDRADRFTTMVQATAVWLMFDAAVLKVAEGLALASFPAVEDYPSTELSRKVGASVRATLNIAFGEGSPLHVPPHWATRFWDLGSALQACEVAND